MEAAKRLFIRGLTRDLSNDLLKIIVLKTYEYKNRSPDNIIRDDNPMRIGRRPILKLRILMIRCVKAMSTREIRKSMPNTIMNKNNRNLIFLSLPKIIFRSPVSSHDEIIILKLRP
jgi:hypothetical protein